MHKYDLSVLIPARNEAYLARTVQDVLEHKQGKTEVVVGLDGAWADPPISAHEDVTIFYSPTPLGQRGMTNQLARLSHAKYVMKLDAHCALDDGFDVKLMSVMQDDYTLVPLMRNLHVFDWVCPKCGSRQYQGPSDKYEICPECKEKRVKEVMWKAKESPRSTAFRFDKTLHFQYWNDFKKREEGKGPLSETLSIQGSCFMLTRDKYWELDICDEKHGSWGQQGVEVALKTWLSGGRVMVNHDTWYAHMFRTQGGDFGFPYPLSGADVDKARKYSRELWIDGKWNKALPGRDLQWILDKFYPVPDWHDEKTQLDKVIDKGFSQAAEVLRSRKGIIFYTDNQVNTRLAHKVQNQLRETGIPIVSASLKPMPHFGTNIHVPMERGLGAYFTQIIFALEKSTADIVYMCEHDVLYHKSHFDFTPPDDQHFYYNLNFWRVRPDIDNFAVHWDAPQVSGLVAYRKLLLDWYKTKYDKTLKEGFDRSYEPGGRNGELVKTFTSEYPNIDVRHKGNLTCSKWSPKDFRDKSTCVNWQESTMEKIPGWDLVALV